VVGDGAVAESPLSFARSRESALAPEKVRMGQEAYAVVKVSDLGLASEGAMAPSRAEAVALMRAMNARSPGLASKLQVVPAFEVNES